MLLNIDKCVIRRTPGKDKEVAYTEVLTIIWREFGGLASFKLTILLGLLDRSLKIRKERARVTNQNLSQRTDVLTSVVIHIICCRSRAFVSVGYVSNLQNMDDCPTEVCVWKILIALMCIVYQVRQLRSTL